LIKGAGKTANDPEARQIGDYYDAFMDESAIEKKGLDPIKAELEEINGIADKGALARVLGSQLRGRLARASVRITPNSQSLLAMSLFGAHCGRGARAPSIYSSVNRSHFGPAA